ncbi:hypothetical protein ACFL4F_02625 [Candidatus Margulisiibacteriota bacterium]
MLEEAWKLGAKFDAWGEHFKLNIWKEALDKTDINADDYLKERNVDEPLPWDFIDTGITKDYLKKEREKAYSLM